ncbi:hypothetical protein GE061_016282 [Apolygus lucorum]|uniref:Retrotransposon gag domain-containing protein n=1 Tax=Apolygus lucorum TaxID=248454 RepID=A0A8S9XFT4_APOLU|nr:hypothetical protein GE061_016282 [Apolygus lucorum]
MSQPPQQFFTLTAGQLQELLRAVAPLPPVHPRPKPSKNDFGGVPEFHGEPELLSQYIERSEELIQQFYSNEEPECYDNKVIINNLRAKIKGKAATGISNNPLNTWAEIKAALIANFSDRRDEEHLILELGKMRQGQTESPFDFHSRVSKHFSLLISKMKNSTEEYTPTAFKLIERTALRSFLMGLHEDIGSLLITKGPTNLNDAISILTNEYQFPLLKKKYFDKKSNQPGNRYPNQQPSPSNSGARFVKPPQKGFQQKPWQTSQFNKQSNNQGQKSQNLPPRDTPYIPHHLRTKDTMSYQTTLTHELSPQDEEETPNETPNEDYEEPDSFLETPEENNDLT